MALLLAQTMPSETPTIALLNNLLPLPAVKMRMIVLSTQIIGNYLIISAFQLSQKR
jgi:hypothetical protein